MSLLTSIDRSVIWTLRIICVVCLLGLMALIALRIIDRALPGVGGAWTDETIELLFGWMVFLGAAVLWRERDHFKVEWIEGKLPARYVGPLNIIIDAVVIAFLVIMVWQGAELVSRANSVSSILRLPRALWLSAIPVSGAIMLVYTLVDLCKRLTVTISGVRTGSV